MKEDYFNLTPPPAQDSPNNIINILNDDCLQAILLKLESVYDFFRAAAVCTRFQNNAKMCFPFRVIEFGQRMYQEDRDEVLFSDAENFLSIFGPRIKSIDCCLDSMNGLDHADFLNLLGKYCGGTLTELHISDGKFSYFRTPFKVLKRLRLVKCSFPNFDPTVIFPELNRLRVGDPWGPSDSENDLDWLANKFPKLEHVNFRGTDLNNHSKFIEFQNRNPQLKSICTGVHSMPMSIWEDIGDRLPNIEFLSLWCWRPFEAGMIDIGTLPRLKNFNLFRSSQTEDTDHSIVKSLISNSLIYKQPIETLRISYVDNELGRMLQNVKTLKTLYIRHSSDDITFEFVNHLPAIQYLRIYHPNLSTAREILRNAKNLVEFQIYIGPLSNVNFNLRVYNSIIALATGRVKVNIFYGTLCRDDILNDKEKQILLQVWTNKSKWVRFEKYYHWALHTYPNITFD